MTSSSAGSGRAIAVGPGTPGDRYDALEAAVLVAGGEISPIDDADALIWDDPGAVDAFAEYLARGPRVRWIQLPWAGIEPFVPNLDHHHIWTSGKDVYSEPVAEWVMAAILSSFRDFHRFTMARSWPDRSGRNLFGASITIVGGGGITRSLLRLLEPWGCRITVVSRSGRPVEGAQVVVTSDSLVEAVAEADAVVLALALTDETKGIIDSRVLQAMNPRAWLINVARGGHIVTTDLIEALQTRSIAGAVLDVTDPEPLPDQSPLWQLDNCIITPHVGNTPEMGLPLLAQRVETNVRNWLAGRPLVGVVDVDAGY